MPRQPNGAGPGEFLLSVPDLPFITDMSAPAALTSALVGAEAPFTWAANDTINVTGLYQVI